MAASPRLRKIMKPVEWYIKGKSIPFLTLDLSEQHLRQLPDELFELNELEALRLDTNEDIRLSEKLIRLTNLKVLSLAECNLDTVPAVVMKLPQLETLFLGNNRNITLPDEMCSLVNLAYLDLYSCDLKSVPAVVMKLSQLKGLRLSNNEKIKLPEEMSSLVNLTYLNLANCGLDTVPPVVLKLLNLQELDLSYNQLISLPDELCRLENIKVLTLTNCDLTTVPPAVLKLPQLEELDLSGNKGIHGHLPDELAGLTNIRVLKLWRINMVTVPPVVGRLTQLEWLDLRWNPLQTLPAEFGQLTNIIHLDLSDCQLHTLPPEVWILTQLEWLRLSSNPLQMLPAEVGQLTNVKHLHLSSCQLDTLPPEVGRLTQLERLDLSSNALQTLPAEVGQLTNVKKLDLSDCQLHTLPPEVGRLTQLEWLDLRSNALQTLPAEVGQLTNVKKLDLSRCRLRTLPPEVWRLTQLEWLRLSYNLLQILPAEVAQLTDRLEPVLSYLQQVGTILRYTDIPELKDYVFHDPPALIEFFKDLFHHDTKALFSTPEVQKNYTEQQLSNFEQDLCERGLIRKDVMTYLLPSNINSDAVAALILRFGLCFKMQVERKTDPSEHTCWYRIPWYLREQMPQKLKRAWPEDVPEDQEQLQLMCNIRGFCPRGLFQRLSVGIHGIVKYRKDWKDGVLAYRKDYPIMMCSKPAKEDIYITMATRGSIAQADEMWGVVHPLQEVLVQLLQEWPGVLYSLHVTCAHCIKAGLDKPHQYDLRDRTADDGRDVRCERVDFTASTSADLVYKPGSNMRKRVHQRPSPLDKAHGPSRGPGVPIVLLLNDEYGTSKGGISTINCQVGQTLTAARAVVYATALRVPKQDQEAADRDGVKLIRPAQLDESAPTLDWLTKYHSVHYPNLPQDVTCIIGHADITDTAARNIWEQRYPQADLMTFNHVIPEDTEYYKGGRKAMKAWEKERDMLDNANNAKAAFSVGKRINDHFDTMYKGDKKPQNHHIFLPKPSDLFLAVNVRPGGEQKVVLTVGRVWKVEKLKGHDLAARAMREVVREVKNTRLRVRGISEDDWETSLKILEDNLNSPDLNPTLLPYGTQEDIRDDMMTAHLVLMPSRSEPFGLVGLEAIAAGIPVLISDKTGLAGMINDLIDQGKLHPDRRHVIVETSVNDSNSAEDAKRWAGRIVDILNHSDSEFEKAARFKRELVESRYWEESHRTFLQACGITAGAADL
ncbi:LRRC7 [Branchiostoma lanceolatum]|uniref:Leucine-rich repeat protein SHOC-2 n=1 Tax=Branchiostoma lanceolatum TaxID=7740 RepID=A0A8J9YSH4_BRALA|nr:LRRC7 [Branchiostoma lanceolatum]